MTQASTVKCFPCDENACTVEESQPEKKKKEFKVKEFLNGFSAGL